jgi:CubicO group peptidase (beta-lactamase class C family)
MASTSPMSDHVVESVVAALSSRVRSLMKQQGVPGIALGIVRGQTLAWAGGFGYADLVSARPLDEHSIFAVASVTKTVTGLAIMQLRDLGKLSLDDSVVRYLPEFAAVRNRYGRAEDVTIRGLLTHRSGLVGEAPTGHWSNLKFPTMAQILELLPRVEIVIEPASAFKYCNLAFALLGEIIARVAGRSFTAYVQAEILAPLGMTASGFEAQDETRLHTATGYMSERYEDVPAVAEDPPMNGYAAAAGLRTSVADLSRWAALQFRTRIGERAGAQILAGASLSEMHRVTYVESDWKTGYAMPWMGVRMSENIYLMHPGSAPGFLSMLAFSTPHRTAVIVLTNKQGHRACTAIAFEALEMIARASREVPERSAPPLPAPASYKPLLGRYAGEPAWGLVLHVEYRDGVLLLVTPPDPYGGPPEAPMRLSATERADVFIVTGGRPAGEALTFELADDGRAVGFVLGDDVARFHRTD